MNYRLLAVQKIKHGWADSLDELLKPASNGEDHKLVLVSIRKKRTETPGFLVAEKMVKEWDNLEEANNELAAIGESLKLPVLFKEDLDKSQHNGVFL